MKKLILAASITAMSSAAVQADAIGVYFGGQVWDSQATGLVGEKGALIDFNLADKKQGSYFIAFEHPLPFIPNAMVSSTTLNTQGNTTLTEEFTFAGKTFATNTAVDTGFDISYLDYTIYYELFDNGLFSFDFGLTGRDFEGDVSVSTSAVTGKLSTDEIIPMLYASANVGLPFTGWNVFAQGNFLSIDDHTLHDYQAGLSYEVVDNLLVDFNVTLGYRSVKLELEDIDNLYTNIEFDGVFLGAVVHF